MQIVFTILIGLIALVCPETLNDEDPEYFTPTLNPPPIMLNPLNEIRALCGAIEALPASEENTKLSVMAANVANALQNDCLSKAFVLQYLEERGRLAQKEYEAWKASEGDQCPQASYRSGMWFACQQIKDTIEIYPGLGWDNRGTPATSPQ